MSAWGRANAREHNARAWLAWHIAYLPNQKRPVKLKALMVEPDGRPARQGATSIAAMQTVMRQWAVAMAFAEAGPPGKPQKPPKKT